MNSKSRKDRDKTGACREMTSAIGLLSMDAAHDEVRHLLHIQAIQI